MGAYKQNSQSFWVGVASDINVFWKPDGTAYGSDNHGNRRLKPDYDIIATISPADMQAVASGELERLRAHLSANLDWMEALRASGDAGFWNWDADDAYTKARTALEGGTV